MTADHSPGLRWGILATGGIAHSFTSDLRTAGLDIRAIGSRSAEGAEAFAHEYEIPRAHSSYESLVADDEVDIVYIATPHPMHAENALRAIENGKHVLVEKAFALTGDEAAEVEAAAVSAGVLAMEAMWTRYLPHMVRIRELVAAGDLGEIRVAYADHSQKLSTDPTHRLNALELGGGALLDLGIYPVSFVWDLLGAPTAISARGRLSETGADTEVATLFTHEGGAVSTTVSSSRAAGPVTAHVVGTEGRIDIDRTWYAPTIFRVTRPDGSVAEEFVPQGDGRGMQYQALAAERIVAEGRRDSDILPLAETVAIMRALDDIRAQLGVRYPGEH
jgi:predicted dehydrogenase